MLPRSVAEQLRIRGHDVVAVTEHPLLRGQSDSHVFEVAHAEIRVVVTENAGDFRVLAALWLQRGQSHGGMVFTSPKRWPLGDPRTVGRLVTALDDLIRSNVDLTHREFWLH
jgi:hypothetical protein